MFFNFLSNPCITAARCIEANAVEPKANGLSVCTHDYEQLVPAIPVACIRLKESQIISILARLSTKKAMAHNPFAKYIRLQKIISQAWAGF